MHQQLGSRQQPILLSASVVMSITGLVVLLAGGPQSVQGRTATDGYRNYLCAIRDSDNELVSCAGSGTSLSLHYNSMSSIHAGAFDGLSALTRLSLSYNSISGIPAGLFDGLSVLTQLGLAYNPTSSIPAGLFDGLSVLTQLNLYNTAISSIPAGTFDGLSALTRLLLYSNAISSISAGTFDRLSALTELSLRNNPFTSVPCDWGVNTAVTTNLQLPAGVLLANCVPLPTHPPSTVSLTAGPAASPTASDPTATPTVPPTTSEPTTLPTQSVPSAPQSTSREGGDDGDSIIIIIMVVLAVVMLLVGVTLFFIVRCRSKTVAAGHELDDWDERQRAGLVDIANPVFRRDDALAARAAQETPVSQAGHLHVGLVDASAGHAALDPGRTRYASVDDPGVSAQGRRPGPDPRAHARPVGVDAGNAHGSLMPTYVQATPVAGGRPADPEYAHLDRDGAPAYASLMPTYGQVMPVARGRPADAKYANLDRGGAPAYASLTPVYGQAPFRPPGTADHSHM